MSANRTKERLFSALDQDPSIMTTKEFLNNHPGFTLDHMQALGLTKDDLKTLEKQGAAKRGYKSTTKETSKGRKQTFTEVMWILLAD